MTEKAKLPMGIEDFEEMRSMDYYYIDKTGLIRTLLENPGKVTLFTRPRRFGKTLNMSMLELKYAENAVFEDGCREALKQIRDRNYEEALIDDGMTTIRKYGIACYLKFDTKINGKPLKSRLPMFCLYVVYSSDLI